jgi:hypothetical protein
VRIKNKSWTRFFILTWGLAYSILPLISNRLVLQWINTNSNQFPVIPYGDSKMYLGRMKPFIEGNNFGSDLLFEKADDGYVIGTGLIFWFWGGIGNFLKLDIFQAYILMIFITALVSFISLYFLVSTVIDNKKWNFIVTSLINLLILKAMYGRPSPVQLTIWISFLFIALIIRYISLDKNKYLIYSFVAFVAILLTNPFYAILLMFIFACVALYRNKNSSRFFTFIFSVSIVMCLFYFSYATGVSEIDFETKRRFGVTYDRFPGAFNLTCASLILFLISLFQFLKSKKQIYLITTFIAISNFFAVNSQIFTGILFEQESHYWLISWSLLFLCFCVILLNTFDLKRLIYNFKLIALVIFLFYLQVFYSVAQINTKEFGAWTAKENKIITILQKKDYDKAVILVNSSVNPDLLDSLHLYSNTYIYWAPIMYAEPISDKEILNRFACTVNSDYNFSKFRNDYSLLFNHKFINEYQRELRWNFLNKYLNRPEIDITKYEKAIAEDYNYLNLVFKNECSKGIYRYKVDFILNEDLELKKLGSERIKYES